jgi:signal transduction histidine kinase
MNSSSLIHRVRLQDLISVAVIAPVAITAASLLWIVKAELEAAEQRQAVSRMERGVKTAAILFAARYPDVTLSWGAGGELKRISAPQIPEVNDDTLIDQISLATGDGAGIFKFDEQSGDFIRVSTTVRNADGSRANGTRLGAGSEVFKSIVRGEPFGGEANVIGVPFYSVYWPIFDRTGKASGIIVSGTRTTIFADITRKLTSQIWIFSLFLAVIFAIIGALVVRSMLSPIVRLAALLSEDHTKSPHFAIPYTDRRNEIGQMARAVAKYRDDIIRAGTDLQERHKRLLKTSSELNMERTKLQHMNAELGAAKSNAELANSAKSMFLTNMSHEFRTPMHAIVNFAKIGLKTVEIMDQRKIEKCFESIQQSATRLLAILNALLDFARLESGTLELSASEADLMEIAWHSKAEVESLLEDKRLTIRIECEPGASRGTFDKLRIAQVFINIFSNAIKFSPVNGVISVKITAAAIENKSAIHCVVSDQGPGIAAKDIDRIFDKFVQSTQMDRPAGGSGLGLAISREIINLHGGKIWAGNGSPGGAEIHFVLPVETLTRGEPKLSSSQAAE